MRHDVTYVNAKSPPRILKRSFLFGISVLQDDHVAVAYSWQQVHRVIPLIYRRSVEDDRAKGLGRERIVVFTVADPWFNYDKRVCLCGCRRAGVPLFLCDDNGSSNVFNHYVSIEQSSLSV